MQRILHARPGVSLVEVVVALTLASVLGATATGAFVTQSRFFDAQEKVGLARGVSRGAMNMIVTELRMLEQENGLVSATPTRITVRAPYALGVVCGNTMQLTISRLPADPSVLSGAETGHSGYAYRDPATGRYTYVEGGAPPSKNGAAICASAGIAIYTDGGGSLDGEAMQLGSVPSPAPVIGTPVLLYQRITYEFRSSVTVPGRIALWRLIEKTGVDEEIVAPFDTTAGFRFYINDGPAPQATVPGVLQTITGIELQLDGLSERPEHDGSHRSVPLSTSVFFKNRPTS
jgi:type II secretory pathway pseudopilin PulG